MGEFSPILKRRRRCTDPSEEMLEAICAEYDGTTETINRLAARFGRERNRIKGWASRLGATRQKEAEWTEKDICYLQEHITRMSMADLAHKLGRTETAIKIKAQRLGVNKVYHEGYSMTSLRVALGVSPTLIARWVRTGKLKGERRNTRRDPEVDVWLFTDANVREFIVKHPMEIDPAKAAWPWLLDVLVGGENGMGRLDDARKAK